MKFSVEFDETKPDAEGHFRGRLTVGERGDSIDVLIPSAVVKRFLVMDVNAMHEKLVHEKRQIWTQGTNNVPSFWSWSVYLEAIEVPEFKERSDDSSKDVGKDPG